MSGVSKETTTYMVGNVEGLAFVIGSGINIGCRGGAWREEVGVVCLPQADIDIESRGKGRDFHVVCPLARLTHLLYMMVKLLLQLLFSVVGGVETLGGGIGSSSSSRLAFGISPHIIDGHVLAVKVCTIPHVLDGGGTQDLVHVLVAVELVGQGVEQAVALEERQWW